MNLRHCFRFQKINSVTFKAFRLAERKRFQSIRSLSLCRRRVCRASSPQDCSISTKCAREFSVQLLIFSTRAELPGFQIARQQCKSEGGGKSKRRRKRRRRSSD